MPTTTPGAIIGHRKDGRPIRLIAGGSPDADPPAADPAQGPPADPPAADPPADPPKDETDWKAEARKWEARAKENKAAVAELDKVKTASMTEQEKAVAAAKVEGRTAAATEYGKRIAAAELKAAAASKGVDLAVIGDLIDPAKFLDDSGEVDSDAIKKVVDKLAKLTPKAPATSGAPMGGNPPPGKPKTLEAAIAARYKK